MDEPGTPGGSPERPAVFFRDAPELRAWFEVHHETAAELWMGLRKRSSPVDDLGLTWADAVPEALCFGWIDSVSQPIDEHTRRQRWTPRRPRSIWSAVNVAHVERLLAEGRMHPAGIAAFEARTPERTGTYSHERSDDPELAPGPRAIVDASAATAAFLAESSTGYRRAALHWIATAKRDDTQLRRAEQLVAACAAGELLRHLRPTVMPRWVERAAAATATATATSAAAAPAAAAADDGASRHEGSSRA